MSPSCHPRCQDGFVQHFAAQPGYEWTPCQGCNPDGAPRLNLSSPPLAEQVAAHLGDYRPFKGTA